MNLVQRNTLRRSGRHPQRRLLLILALAGLVAGPLLGATTIAADGKHVELTIDYGDGVQKRFTALAWKEKMTVFDALQQASQHRRGIKESHSGSGEALFITSIDDVRNEGVGKNWLYEVNGEKADRSCGIYELKAGDSILWRFGKQK